MNFPWVGWGWVGGWVVGKYDFNENPVVNFDFELGPWTLKKYCCSH